MNIKQFLTIMLLLLNGTVVAQYSKYVVKLKNKAGTPHSIATPNTYLSAAAISRRSTYNIAIDSTDLPITPRYLDSIRLVPNVTIISSSKWLNQVAIITNSMSALAKINSFPFVQNTTGIAAKLNPNQVSVGVGKNKIVPALQVVSTDVGRVQLSYGNSFNQINIHNGQFLHDRGFLGNNMNIAMMDAGFSTVATNSGVDSLRLNNQIKETWDFVDNQASVTEDNSHGFYCLSIIGANKPNLMIGSAPKANFYLYRTEDVGSEYPIEEHHWVVAAERADSLGVQVFSTSLGYIDFDNSALDYTYAQRDGNTAMMTRASDLAAKKGILVFNAAGNNGATATDYKFVAIPADGDSVVAVASCSSVGLIANSSAWGPAFGGKPKPNITSLGVTATYINLGGTTGTGSGTSFACPNIAGLGTALWQAFPEVNNMSIVDALQKAGHLATPDDRFGFGIPNMKKAFVVLLNKIFTQSHTINNCTVNVNFSAKDNGIGSYSLERKSPGAPAFVPLNGSINATGNTWGRKDYTLTDNLSNQPVGAYIYRVKHIWEWIVRFIILNKRLI